MCGVKNTDSEITPPAAPATEAPRPATAAAGGGTTAAATAAADASADTTAVAPMKSSSELVRR
jgi:hypothetical protein